MQGAKMQIPFAKPSVGLEEEEAVLEVLRSGWLTTGPKTLLFEKEFRAVIKANYALAVSSATAGLHLSVEACGIKDGDLVITTPYTFAATAEVIRYCQANPIFVDIEEDSLNINPFLLEKVIKNNNLKVKAIIPVHLAGLPCAIEEIKKIAEEKKLAVIEDCAHAFPVKLNDKFLGTFGDTGVFSFYANKTITTAEGGMVVTNDESLAKRIKLMRLHGIDRDAWDRYQNLESSWYYEIVEAGYKYNLTDLSSALGLVQLKKAYQFRQKRSRIAEKYQAAFKHYDCFKLPLFHPEHAWHLYILRLVPEKLGIDRNGFIGSLVERGIGTSVHYIPLHLMPYYRQNYGYKPTDFPVALKAFKCAISLPIYPALTEDEIQYIIENICELAEKYYAKKIYT